MDLQKYQKDLSQLPATNFEFLAGQLLLREYAPAAVLVSESGEILYSSGRTSKYLEPGVGKTNWNLFALAREGLQQALNETFYRAIDEKKAITVSDINMGFDTSKHRVEISVRPIFEPDIMRGLLLVVFTEKNRSSPRNNNTMKILANNTDVAILFLDHNLNVRRFTIQATDVLKHLPFDAGRSLAELGGAFLYPNLMNDARDVLMKLVCKEMEIQSVDGRWFTLRIMPYLTIDNCVDGVVISFVDITAAKRLELDLQNSQRASFHAFEHALLGMAIITRDEQWREINRSLCDLLGYTEAELRSTRPMDVIPRDEQKGCRSLLQKLLQDPDEICTKQVHCLHKSGLPLPVRLKATVVRTSDGDPDSFCLQFESLKSPQMIESPTE